LYHLEVRVSSFGSRNSRGGRMCPGRRGLSATREARAASALALLLGFAPACAPSDGGAAPAALEVHDDVGRRVALRRPVRRIVSAVPSATDLLLALGAADRLIARTDYDTDPRLAHLPSLGRDIHPGIEAVLALRPDLVIAQPDEAGRGFVAGLDAVGVAVYAVDVHRQRVAGIAATARRLALLIGEAARGDSLAIAIESGLDSLRRTTPPGPRPSVLYVVWHQPAYAAGAGSYVHELIEAAGGVNVLGDVRLEWPEVGLEEIVRRDPDYIVVPSGRDALRPEWLADLPGRRELGAVRERRVIVVDNDLFNRPGPRVVEAARVLADALREREAAALRRRGAEIPRVRGAAVQPGVRSAPRRTREPAPPASGAR
jgi:iron complex transport system substrate-binding protein